MCNGRFFLTLGLATFDRTSLGVTAEAKMSASSVRAQSCSSPRKSGVEGFGFFYAAMRSKAAYAAKSAEERKGMSESKGKNSTVSLSRSCLVDGM